MKIIQKKNVDGFFISTLAKLLHIENKREESKRANIFISIFPRAKNK